MTVLLQCKNVNKEYGDTTILKDINIEVQLGEKIGIVGNNGVGKTTLANILTGNLEATSGEIIWYKSGIQIGYMQQATDYKDLKNTLSGGEKTKALLTQVLYSKCNMLILDEPTNHLDYEGVNWLIKRVKAFRGTVIIISHDRYFLDQCVTRIVEIESCTVASYKGNYSNYRDKKKKEYEDNLHLYFEQEKIKDKIRTQIEELKNWSGKAHREAAVKARISGNKKGGKQFNRAKAKKMDQQIKSRIKRLEKINIEGIEKPKEEAGVFFQIDEAKRVGSVIVEAKDVAKKFDEKILFKNTSFYIKPGEKIGLYGINGCGKSTLIKAILGEVSLDGELYVSQTKKIGYISQEVTGMQEELTILEIFDVRNREELGEIRTELNLMGFDSESLSKKIGCLSLGERMKLKLLLMIKEKCEVLILDEPTNHIDLHVREQLEEALNRYKGTIILVTHDRYMLEKICDKLLVFDKSKITRYEYGINEYLQNLNKKKVQKKANLSREQMEQSMILENRLAYVVGVLSETTPNTPEYEELDKQYKNLMELRNSGKMAKTN
ncbi:ribosomal protection-like ABC-F family protein [Inconstantimicrobium mannanitabidum]|uniref:ABC transporter ATP-binding protein n=1 Tax=Inconstantimicrobium mannanitabidum TaxID=1604901 RepID=A0ACB5RBR3_9CLOT|nr:ABC-F family ATP-binding cassette domain-containing protein [Clostridium sp. TW13]GKX66678.1 ABC transporter ATP-binding protein [Clostridium sp. TW13]